MRRWIVAALAVAAIAAGTMPAFADSAGTVNAHVTVAAPCLTIDQQSVDFGTLPFTVAPAQRESEGDAAITAANCGGSRESILAHGTRATGSAGTVWGLTDNLASFTCPVKNVYKASVTSTTGGSIYLALDDRHFVDQPSGPLPIGLSVFMPCDGSAGGGETMSFSYVFTATAIASG